MEFKDPQFEEVYRRNSRAVGGLTDDQRQVYGLFATWGWFKFMEGAESPRVREAVNLLVSQELRPALRKWYRSDASMNPFAAELREQLCGLAGERFGSDDSAQ